MTGFRCSRVPRNCHATNDLRATPRTVRTAACGRTILGIKGRRRVGSDPSDRVEVNVVFRGSQLVAAMDRQHPRDLFDVWQMFEAGGLSGDVVECFVT